jgi:hypothetical protein
MRRQGHEKNQKWDCDYEELIELAECNNKR